MILRVDGNSLIRMNIGPNNDETEFALINPEFIKANNLPYSISGYYKYDIDGITIIIDEVKELEFLKEQYLTEVFNKFTNMMAQGIFLSSLGFNVDNRRGDGKDDKDNIQSLIELGLPQVNFRDADGAFHILDTAQLTTLKQEMIQDGLGKYQWKWGKENAIVSAPDIATLEAIII